MLKLCYFEITSGFIHEPVKGFFLIGINVPDPDWIHSSTLFCQGAWMDVCTRCTAWCMYVQLALFIGTCTKSKTNASTY